MQTEKTKHFQMCDVNHYTVIEQKTKFNFK